MKYSLFLTPARQPMPWLMACHSHINHPTRPWDKSKLEINVLQGLMGAWRGMLERGWGGGRSQWGDTLPKSLPSHGKGLQPRAQQRVGTGIRPCLATPASSKKPGCRAGCSAATPQRAGLGCGHGATHVSSPAGDTGERGRYPQSCRQGASPRWDPAKRHYRCLAR